MVTMVEKTNLEIHAAVDIVPTEAKTNNVGYSPTNNE